MNKKMCKLLCTGILSIGLLTGCADTNSIDTSVQNTKENYAEESEVFLAGYDEGVIVADQQRAATFDYVSELVQHYGNLEFILTEKHPKEYNYKDFIEGFFTAIYDKNMYITSDGKEVSEEDAIDSYVKLYEEKVVPGLKESVSEDKPKEEEKEKPKKVITPEKPKKPTIKNESYEPCLDCGTPIHKGNQIQYCDKCASNYTFCSGGCGELIPADQDLCGGPDCVNYGIE